MKDYNNFCNNCGKQGHLFHQCKNPITSIGIIVYTKNNNNEKEYLMIRRKDSLGYVDFIRGKYPLFNKRYLKNIISEMTNSEKSDILNLEFDILWNKLWGEYIGLQYRSEEKASRDKFNSLKSGINLLNNTYNLETLIEESKTEWNEPEWGFAKGRRNYQEKDLGCALREFEEETGYSRNSITLIQNIIPLEEIFTGSNYKSYKHKYYLAYMNKNVKPVSSYQKTEVSEMSWCNYNDSISRIRPYNIEKKNLISKVEDLLNNYDFY
jgi:8-oxo-dGTP pyrophosphatase MutT (NUDIX family)